MGCYLCKFAVPVPKEDDVDIVTGRELLDIVAEKLRITNLHEVSFADGSYALVDPHWVTTFLTFDLTEHIPYIPERFDCDDYAWVVAGEVKKWFWKSPVKASIAFGMLWGDIRKESDPDKPRGHAVNFLVTRDRNIVLIEPQNDGVFNFTSKSTVWRIIA